MASKHLLSRINSHRNALAQSTYPLLSRTQKGYENSEGFKGSRDFSSSYFCNPHDDEKKKEKSPMTRGSLVKLGYAGLYGHTTGGRVMGARHMSTTRDLSSPSPVETVEFVDGNVLSDTASVIDVTTNAQTVGEVAAAASECSPPVAFLHYFIEGVHVQLGLPWWASIALTTVAIRSVTVPLMIGQLKATYRLTMLRPKLDELREEMDGTSDPQELEKGKRRMQQLFREYKVTPFTPFKGMLIQAPLFLCFFFAITNMAENVPSFKTGGPLWFPDLSAPDSMYILPVLTALSFLLNVELNMQEGLEGSPVASKMKKVSRVFAVLMIPFTMNFPKALFCYWITSNFFSLAYGSVMKRKEVKEFLGIPIIPATPERDTRDPMLSQPKLYKDAIKSVAEEDRSPSASHMQQRLKALEKTVKSKRGSKKF